MRGDGGSLEKLSAERMGEERDARDLKMSGGGRRGGNSEMAVGETLYYLGHVGPDNIET
jgi:hypothetical protein